VSVPCARGYTKFRDTDFVWADDVFAAPANALATPYFLPDTGYALPLTSAPRPLDPVRDRYPARGLFISAASTAATEHDAGH
jgi:hypothetical protein